MLGKSISLKVIASVVFVLLLGMAALFQIEGHLTKSFFTRSFLQEYSDKTLLLSSQMEGGIKWKKSQSIEDVYKDLRAGDKQSNLSNTLVTDADQVALSVFDAEHYKGVDVKAILAENIESLEAGAYKIEDLPTHLVVLKSVFDVKKQEVIGYVAMAWSKKSSLDALDKIGHTILATFAVITLLIVGALVFSLKSMVINPIRSLQDSMVGLAEGHLDTIVPFTKKEDEIGKMAGSVQVFKDSALEKRRLEFQQQESKAKAEREKQEALDKMAKRFELQVGGLVEGLASAAVQLQSTAESMRAMADTAAQSSQAVSSASEQVSANVGSVASAMEEMSQTSSQIASQAQGAKQRSSDASVNAQQTSTTVKDLDHLIGNIGEFVASIHDIAEQTNLLALNATIEAARAGDAGKGFAVVADEVKKLATETSGKTEEINSRIAEIQNVTHKAVNAMNGILSNIADIDDSVVQVSASIEQQTATNNEIVRSINEASSDAQNVTSTISDVHRSAKETGESADSVLDAAQELAKLSTDLKDAVDSFLEEMRFNASEKEDGIENVQADNESLQNADAAIAEELEKLEEILEQDKTLAAE